MRLRDFIDSAPIGKSIKRECPREQLGWANLLDSFDAMLERPATVADMQPATLERLWDYLRPRVDCTKSMRSAHRRMIKLALALVESRQLPEVNVPTVQARPREDQKQSHIQQQPAVSVEVTPDMTLASFVLDVYAVEREIREKTQQQLLLTVARFCDSLGREGSIKDLTHPNVNASILYWSKKWKPRSLKNHRTNILSVWLHAWGAHNVVEQPISRRIRKPVVPSKLPKAFTRNEVQRLLTACDRLPGSFVTGLPRGLTLEALIRCCYDVGARRGDLISMKRDQFDLDSGVVVWEMSKTRFETIHGLNPSTVAVLRELDRFATDRELMFDCGSVDQLHGWFRKLLAESRVESTGHGSQFQRLRRTSATQIEKQRPGQASLHLGHRTSGLDRKSYLDPRLLSDGALAPPKDLDSEDEQVA